MRCHDPDACCAGQKACPTPRACGCEPEIADLVAALNAGGGHGEKPGWIGLADELKRRAQA